MTPAKRYRRTASALALAWIVLHGALAAQESVTTVILVRHAERAAAPADDPGLTPEGNARAAALLETLRDAGIGAIYSTRFARTRATAQPIAQALGIPIITDDFRANPMAAGNNAIAELAAGLAERIRTANRGQTVLVVGHSNTVPAIVKALGAGEVGPIADNEYDNLFIVRIQLDGAVTLIRANYGERSPPGTR